MFHLLIVDVSMYISLILMTKLLAVYSVFESFEDSVA